MFLSGRMNFSQEKLKVYVEILIGFFYNQRDFFLAVPGSRRYKKIS